MYSYAGVSIPFHILIPNGICQALLAFAAGYARDRGARPAYILAFSSFLVASAPFVLTMTSGPHQELLAIAFGCVSAAQPPLRLVFF